ncbi:MAG: hypothetical protein J7L45_03420, partial [Candidatus Aenigmarchaeota archaeon]|nr:hypothetical protein [Candidatus Aenigmarchaeota archaeon]
VVTFINVKIYFYIMRSGIIKKKKLLPPEIEKINKIGKIALFIEKNHESIIEKYLRGYEERSIVEIGVTSPGDEEYALERWLYKKSIAPNLVGVDKGRAIDRLRTFYAGKLLRKFSITNQRVKEAVYHFFRRERNNFREDDYYDMVGWSFDDALKKEIIPFIEDSYITFVHFYLEEYDKIKDLIDRLDLKKGDAKSLSDTISEESTDLILAFGLFGQLDLGYLEGKNYEEKMKYREEVLSTYDERVKNVIESMYSVLKSHGRVLISNENEVRLIETNPDPYTLDYFKNRFLDKFEIEKIIPGKDRYLMLCRKE